MKNKYEVKNKMFHDNSTKTLNCYKTLAYNQAVYSFEIATFLRLSMTPSLALTTYI